MAHRGDSVAGFGALRARSREAAAGAVKIRRPPSAQITMMETISLPSALSGSRVYLRNFIDMRWPERFQEAFEPVYCRLEVWKRHRTLHRVLDPFFMRWFLSSWRLES